MRFEASKTRSSFPRPIHDYREVLAVDRIEEIVGYVVRDQDAELIAALLNAAHEINPDNPMAAAKAMPALFRMVERIAGTPKNGEPCEDSPDGVQRWNPDGDPDHALEALMAHVDMARAVYAEATAPSSKAAAEMASRSEEMPAVSNGQEEGMSDVRKQIAEKTDTRPEEWEPCDGPETGVGMESWYFHSQTNQYAYVCQEQDGSITVEVTSGLDSEELTP